MIKPRRIVIHRPGGRDQLKLEEFTPKGPAAHEVQVAVTAFGVNYADICVRWGVYESAKKFVGWPITPGFEYAGTIIQVGSAVTKWKVGDQVFGVSRFDSYATHVTVAEHFVYALPKKLTLEVAAGVPAVYLTAYHALFQNIVIHPHSTILIHSAAGGVGSCLVQMAKLKGHRVVGVVGSASKCDYVKNLGADLVISKSQENWVKRAREFAPDGYQVVLDANGADTLQDGYELLGPMGKLISYGFHTMLPKDRGTINWPKLIYQYLKTPRFNPVHMTSQNKSLVTFNLSFLFDETEIFSSGMKEVIDWLESGKILPPKITTFRMENIGEAHAALESGKTMGKLVILT